MAEFSIASVQEAVAAAYPDRDAIVQGPTRVSSSVLTDRSRRLARALSNRGLGVRHERSGLESHESGQDHIALYLHDGPEYIEAMLGAFKARAVPFNINYRYVPAELRHVLQMAEAKAIVYHGSLTPTLAEVLPGLPAVELVVRIADGSGHPLLPGAVDYEALLAESEPAPPAEGSPDDLSLLLTGGTTGFPKGVLWRQADVLVAGMSVWDVRGRREWGLLEEHVTAAATPVARRTLVAPPLMHGAGQWTAFQAILNGGTVVLPTVVHRREPADVLHQAAANGVDTLVIVGDAFARPLVDELRRGGYDLECLRVIASGGATLTRETKAALLELLPRATILDGVGSSETGGQARARTTRHADVPPGCFQPVPGTVIVSDDRTRVLPADDERVGWLGRSGRIPLGYLNDPDKTAATFPLIGGVRVAVPGDRARHAGGGLVQLLGRESVTINSGGEKIFAEEVEAAILSHPAVEDVTVVGRPSDRWGSEVVAIVALRTDEILTGDELRRSAAQRLASYKLPKDVIFVSNVRRSAAGKADYQWAAKVATGQS